MKTVFAVHARTTDVKFVEIGFTTNEAAQTYADASNVGHRDGEQFMVVTEMPVIQSAVTQTEDAAILYTSGPETDFRSGTSHIFLNEDDAQNFTNAANANTADLEQGVNFILVERDAPTVTITYHASVRTERHTEPITEAHRITSVRPDPTLYGRVSVTRAGTPICLALMSTNRDALIAEANRQAIISNENLALSNG